MRNFLILSFALAAGPAMAELAEDADPRACVAQQIEFGSPVAACVNRAQSPCIAEEPGSISGIACFVTAKDQWTRMIAGRMSEIRAAAPDEIAAIAAIEAKYDVLQNLNQCARMEELSAVRDIASAQIQWQTARCEATAIGLAFVKLMLQSRDIE